MRVEVKEFKKSKFLVVVVEYGDESDKLDEVFGNEVGEDGKIAEVVGEVRVADGYMEHYLRLERKA